MGLPGDILPTVPELWSQLSPLPVTLPRVQGLEMPLVELDIFRAPGAPTGYCTQRCSGGKVGMFPNRHGSGLDVE